MGNNCYRPRYRRPYGCMAFLFDVFMCILTAIFFGGFPVWIIWIFVREMRNR